MLVSFTGKLSFPLIFKAESDSADERNDKDAGEIVLIFCGAEFFDEMVDPKVSPDLG